MSALRGHFGGRRVDPEHAFGDDLRIELAGGEHGAGRGIHHFIRVLGKMHDGVGHASTRVGGCQDPSGLEPLGERGVDVQDAAPSVQRFDHGHRLVVEAVGRERDEVGSAHRGRNVVPGEASGKAHGRAGRALLGLGTQRPVADDFDVEGARGKIGVWLVSDGTKTPYRVKLRAPGYCNLSLFAEAAQGVLLADAVSILGSLDLVIPEIDR